MTVNTRQRYLLLLASSIILVCGVTFYLRNDIRSTLIPTTPINEEAKPPPYKPKYKPESPSLSPPIIDNFPLAAAAHSHSDLPSIPPWNQPPKPHVKESTPLFIGFTRNWRLLQQVVVSYITSGWPPEDIYVVENTGVMDSNKNGQLSLQNPFFLNHTRLHLFGVNVLMTPTLFTFAQLQNFYLFESIQRNWTHYFWSHMDVATLSFENEYAESHKLILPPSDPKHDYSDFKSIYRHCVESLRAVRGRWAMRFFSYDRLALVNVNAFKEIGGWDTMIPFYMTDCDMHARIEMAGMGTEEVPAGLIYDVASALDDLLVLYRKKNILPTWKDPNAVEEEMRAIAESESELGEGSVKSKRWNASSLLQPSEFLSPKEKKKEQFESDTIFSEEFFVPLEHTLAAMQGSKFASSRGRNTWQGRQVGGMGEPFYRDAAGFEIGIQMTIQHGRNVYSEKWGHRDCDIVALGLKQDDAWRVEHDW